jgi:hypothetical protein
VGDATVLVLVSPSTADILQLLGLKCLVWMENVLICCSPEDVQGHKSPIGN